jgi:hypothetical protein
MSNDAPHPDPPKDERWTQLIAPLRKYAPADASKDWEQVLHRHVCEIVVLFRDKETEPERWMLLLAPLLKAIWEPKRPKNDDPLNQELTLSLAYIQSARGFGLPRPAHARKLLSRVREEAKVLSDAIFAVLADPWMSLASGTEMQVAAARARRESKDDKLPEDLDSVVLELMCSGQATFSAIMQALTQASQSLPTVAGVATVGIDLLDGNQLKGRPRETGSHLPTALLAMLIKQRYAPPPARGRRGHRPAELWRKAVTDFVQGILTQTGLPVAPRDFLEENLRAF